MREVSYFEYEICEERFENSWECKAHELGHEADEFPHDELHMWGNKGNRITVKNIMENADLVEDIRVVETANKKAKDYLRSVFDKADMECPYDSDHYPDEDGLIYYDEDPDDWVSLANKQAELDAIREKFSCGD